MKILTLNAHSLQEADYEQKFMWFLEYILIEQPDLIALQEVNQTASAPEFPRDWLKGMVCVPGNHVPVRGDNHAAWLAFALEQAGFDCSWTWLPIKLGYDKYDEGLALIRLNGRIQAVDVLQLSGCCEYDNWKTRKALGVKFTDREDWFYNVHMGWWNDSEEPFCRQWEALNRGLDERKESAPVWLLGDFNAPAEIRGEGYDCIRNDGWLDTWLLADETCGDATVVGNIDGWRSEIETRKRGMRMDHIWCSRSVPVRSARVAFDGQSEPRVSDHCGVLLETKSVSA